MARRRRQHHPEDAATVRSARGRPIRTWGIIPFVADTWIYDVALSYAGQQRAYVERVAAHLKKRGASYYYDRDDPILLLGRHLAEELPRIYEKDAASVVIFISQDYVDKDWTRLERRAALSRAVRERRPYVLPARFDKSELPGLITDVAYADLTTQEPEDFADVILQWLGGLGIVRPTGA
jgi:hypothetical protein